MDELLEQSLLYDFYGELLTSHQKEIYVRFVQEDLSLAEIASEFSISRQAVHDLVKRCRKILEDYEKKLHLVERFLLIKEQVHRMDNLVDGLQMQQDVAQDTLLGKKLEELRDISQLIIEEL